MGPDDVLNLATAVGTVLERSSDGGADANRLLTVSWDGLTTTGG